MTKNALESPDATLSLLTVAEAPNESNETCPLQGTIFDDLSLIGALLFGDAICEPPVDEVASERGH